jgi:uncharacterized protein
MTTSRRTILLGCALAVAATMPNAAGAQERISIAAASVGGAFYAAAGGISKVWSDIGQQPSIEVTGGSIHNSSLLHRKQVMTALISQGAIWEAWNSVGLFKGQEKHTNVRAVIPLHVSYMHGWAKPESNIQAYRDIAGRTISGGPSGGTSDIWMRQMMSAIGNPAKRYVTASFADTTGLLRDGLIDAASASGGVPMGAAMEATSTFKARIFGIKHKEDVDKTVKALPFLRPAEMPAKTYPGQDEAVLTVADWNAYFVHKDMDEKLVYEFTKKAFESRDAMMATFAGLRTVQHENVKNIVLPLHRGAYRYYQERGIPIADEAKPVD